jgi:cytochrome c biogenesis protein CcmG/thiol:disulfide interchange protein DsbE
VGADPRARMGLDWGVAGLPETFVLDGAGRVILRYAGPITTEIVDSRIRPAILSAQSGQ